MYLYLPEWFNITGKFLPKSEIHSKYFYDHGRDYAKYSPEVFNISDNRGILSNDAWFKEIFLSIV